MKTKNIYLASFIILLILIVFRSNGQNSYEIFLKENYYKPNDYLEKIFEEKDLVVLYERMHSEFTQYEFIFDLMSQEWFITDVGVVFCEVITRTIQNEIDDLLLSDNLSEEILHEKLINICRNSSIHTLWTPSSVYYLLRMTYKLNQTLESKNKIRIIGADVEFSWTDIINRDDTRNFKKSERHILRDKYMADYISDWYIKNLKIGERSKALIIMNSRHSVMNKNWSVGDTITLKANAGAILKYYYPEKSTNVFLNDFINERNELIQKGTWDYLFENNGNIPVGFLLKDSPFGKDNFDLFPYIKTDLKYEDVFEHMIFYNPVNKFIISNGINGLVEGEFEKELTRRYKYNWWQHPKTFFQTKRIRKKWNEENRMFYKVNGNNVKIIKN